MDRDELIRLLDKGDLHGLTAACVRALMDAQHPGWDTATLVAHDKAGELVGAHRVSPSRPTPQ